MRNVRKWEIGTSGKNLGMTRQQIHMEKDECVLAHITHQMGREHPPEPTDKHAWPRELEPDATEPWSPAFSEMQ